ncbi:transposase [Rhodobacterales bacterium 52_120_T64]|nr:transposase [Rhodobacterales bacterium 52_120_T64]
MSNYRRMRIEGATYFFTISLADRGSSVLVDSVDVLRKAYTQTIIEQPVWSDAFVVLPDHLHAVWTLPEGDADFSTRWRKIKARFSHALSATPVRSQSKIAKGERGIWQRRFWEHLIRDDRDYGNHMEYCWGNPVRHGLVERVADWPYSSFHRDVRRGIVPKDWT